MVVVIVNCGAVSSARARPSEARAVAGGVRGIRGAVAY